MTHQEYLRNREAAPLVSELQKELTQEQRWKLHELLGKACPELCLGAFIKLDYKPIFDKAQDNLGKKTLNHLKDRFQVE